jgi:7-cyano-7-deazaguanine synthase in queuosine biosynthesis
MLSGGLDSVVALILEKDHVKPIYVNLHSPYSWKEKKVIEMLKGYGYDIVEIDSEVVRKEFNNVPTIKDQIIPGRNLYLAVIGAMNVNVSNVWIVSLYGEMHRFMLDKSKKFYKDGSRFLSFVFGRKINLDSPYKMLTKAEVVNLAISNGISKELLSQTSTCYHDTLWRCGECSTCFKRWVAMTCNNIEEEYSVDPWKSEEADRLINAYRKAIVDRDYRHYSKKRIYETSIALKKVGIKL